MLQEDRRILLVDDDETVLRGMHSLLSPHFEVHTATCARLAREAFKIHRFDAVIADFVMPQENGLDLLFWTRQQHPDTLRVLCSGALGQDIANDLLRDGEINGFISKAGNLSSMVEQMQKLLSA